MAPAQSCRAKENMSGDPKAFLQTQGDGVCLALKVQPRASKNEIGPVAGGELKIRVTAPPVDSAANRAVIELLADRLECPRGAVRMVRGQASRHKVVWIGGLSVEQALQKLNLE
jgi:uncharacterized protein (TIGR00251 family)